jgi:hypothetical protein
VRARGGPGGSPGGGSDRGLGLPFVADRPARGTGAVNLVDYYRRNVTYISRTDPRLARIAGIVAAAAPRSTSTYAWRAGHLLGCSPSGACRLAGVDV